MAPYLILFVSFLFLWFSLELNSYQSTLSGATRWLSVLPLAIFAIIYAGHIGSDNESYGYLFEVAEDFPVEPGFSILMIGAKNLGLSYGDFMKTIAVVQILLLASIVSRLRDPLFFILFYISSFFLNFHFNAIRNSLALLIIAALFVRFKRPTGIAFIFSMAIHYSSIFTQGMQKLALTRHQMLAIGLVAIIAVLIASLWLHPEILLDQMGGFFIYAGHLLNNHDFDAKPIYPALLVKLVVVGLLHRNGGNRFYFAVFAIFVFLTHVTSPTLARVCDLVLFLAILDFCMLHRLIRYRLITVTLTLVLVLSSLMIPWSDCQNGGESNWCVPDAF